jgi:hypothetical protein
MAERALLYAFDIGLPVERRAGCQWAWELGQRMEEDVVNKCIRNIGNGRCQRSGHQQRHNPVVVHIWLGAGQGRLVSCVGRGQVSRGCTCLGSRRADGMGGAHGDSGSLCVPCRSLHCQITVHLPTHRAWRPADSDDPEYLVHYTPWPISPRRSLLYYPATMYRRHSC